MSSIFQIKYQSTLQINKFVNNRFMTRIVAMRLIKSKPLVRAIQGAMLAFGAPLGWLTIRYFNGIAPLTELSENIGLYLYMLFGTITVFSLFGWYVGNKEDASADLALHDSLTGLYNVRYFHERLTEEVQEAKRSQTPLTLIYFDLDHFKLINDTYGHAVGDKVLVAASHAAVAVLRKHEIVARVGGEEFVGLLPRCSIEHGKETAERLRHKISTSGIMLDNGDFISATVSLGVACLKLNDTEKTLYERADKALYKAKSDGRNQVRLA